MFYHLQTIVKSSLTAVLLTVLVTATDARVFTNQAGKTIEAELVSIQGDTVTIRRNDEQTQYTIELGEFSLKDQKFIKAEQAAGRLSAKAYTPQRASTLVTPVVKDPLHANASQQIDRLLEAHRKQQGVAPRPITDDATYLRRAYLKIIGRIPTHAEAVHFLNDECPDKRERLVDKLLDSPGYVSHNFNLWADVLRVRTTGRDGGYHGGIYYAPWLKEQIRSNIPYDLFVERLLTAEGYPWENPAVAYYLRDFGMPLDNMSMTAQIFLGTQLQCAQCHDHPDDVWTQMDFYQLSAFTYGLRTGINLRSEVPELKELMKYLRANTELEKDSEGRRNPFFRITNDFFQPLRFGVVHSKRQLKLPHDYQYEDAAPNDVIQPAVLYGEMPTTELHDSSAKVESYADWMVSENNKRFTKVISNRMWKHAMGKGLIEPIDNLTDSSVADVPELLDYLETLMRSLDYDLKQYLRILYNTAYFQRESVIDNPDLDDDFHYEGPIFQRMSAEQIWDSLATLMTPDIDHIHLNTYSGRSGRTQYNSDYEPAAATYLKNLTPEDLGAHVMKIFDATKQMETNRNAFYKMRDDPQYAGTQAFKDAKRAFNRSRNEYNQLINPDPSSTDFASMTMMAENMQMEQSQKADRSLRHIRRASELNSPENNGHLLQIFGQSDRELIENAETGSNIIQALFLMNSAQTNKIMVERSTPVMEARLAKTPEAKLETLYIGFLSRKPTDQERDALLPLFIESPQKASERVIWAMMNTQQFLFIQ
ncbi:MAG: DUF1549 domain-containing protein [Verrucomicrobiota bacterium]